MATLPQGACQMGAKAVNMDSTPMAETIRTVSQADNANSAARLILIINLCIPITFTLIATNIG